MKNKKFTYFLGFLVVVVWGVIVYRIYDSVAANQATEPFVAIKTPKEDYNDRAIPKDTSHLLLNYRDPFRMVKQKDTVKLTKSVTTARSSLQNVKPALNWDFIKYSGYIREPGTKKLLAVVNINGKALMMSEGETAEQVKLIKNLQDSIKVSFKGKTAYIKI